MGVGLSKHAAVTSLALPRTGVAIERDSDFNTLVVFLLLPSFFITPCLLLVALLISLISLTPLSPPAYIHLLATRSQLAQGKNKRDWRNISTRSA